MSHPPEAIVGSGFVSAATIYCATPIAKHHSRPNELQKRGDGVHAPGDRTQKAPGADTRGE